MTHNTTQWVNYGRTDTGNVFIERINAEKFGFHVGILNVNIKNS